MVGSFRAMKKRKIRNYFEYCEQDYLYQRRHDFEPPLGCDSYSLTLPGSVERIEVYRKRLELGFELFASPISDEAIAIEKAIAEQMEFQGSFEETISTSERTRRRIR
tara:strand:- start:1740 stop:2060 length:321 start_codon:yes stop_codon:yes gene_type:complete